MNMSADRTLGTTDTKMLDPDRLLGWLVFALMVFLVTLSGFAVSQGWDGHNVWRFTLVAFVAGVVSGLLAKSRVLDGFAIVISIATGVAFVWTIIAAFGGHLEGSFWEQLRGYPEPVIEALFRDQITGANRELTADTLLSLTIWMSAWIGMWLLVRVGFVAMALLAPAILILANQHFASGVDGWIIIAMIGLSLLVAVLQRYASKRRVWNYHRVPVSDSMAGRALLTGLAIAVVVSSTIMVSPEAWSQTVLQPMIERTVNRLESARTDAQFWFDDLVGTNSADPAGGSYSDFSDGFEIGGPLTLTDEPQVLVQTDVNSAPYLKARSYDEYTGRGWTSNSGATDETPETMVQAQELRYNPGWEVALSNDARSERESVTLNVSPLTPDVDTVLSVDSFLSADMQTVVRMGWTSVTEMPLTLSVETLNQLPPDVQRLGSLLLQSELTGGATPWGPAATSGTMQAAIDQEVDDLARRGMQVQWTASSEGIVDTLYVTGQLPVFDDVEAVFRHQQAELMDSDYRTTSLTSTASPDQLAAAGTDYPDWVIERYLNKGETATDRTMQLAEDIVGDETNPYQQSVLLEQWLRENIGYDESVDAPPGDQDLVDYVLFDHTYGYCEHYAAAMTVMLRSLGVPSRVAVGYAPGEWDEASAAYLYRHNNAHAWVEVYFPGYGWVPFEPTANRPLGEFDVEPGDSDLDLNQQSLEEAQPTEPPIPTADVATPDLSTDTSQATPEPTEENELSQPPVVLEADQSSGPPRWLLVSGAVAMVTAVLAGGIWMMWSWSLRNLAPAAGFMRRIQRVGSWLGIRSNSTTTPQEYARNFENTASGISVPVKRITRAYEIETFGPRDARDQVIAEARSAWNEIKRNWFRLLRRR